MATEQRWRRMAAVVAACAAALCVAALWAPFATARSRQGVGPAPTWHSLQLVLPLVADLRGLRRFATSVTTPGSPQYGQYRPVGWLSRRFGASTAHRARVVTFLRHAGARAVHIDATGLFVDATLSRSIAQRLFATRLALVHPARAAAYTRPAAPVILPPGLRGLVTGVVGLDSRPVAHAQLRRASESGGAPPAGPLGRAAAAPGVPSGYEPASGTPSSCPAAVPAGGFTPHQYLTAYGFAPLQAASVLGQGERVAVIEIDGFRTGDIRAFATCFGLRLPPINAFGVGVERPLAPGGESTLDLEVLDAAAPGLRSIDVYESTPEASSVLRALTAPLQNSGYKPQVISASLGLCEEQTLAAVGRGGLASSEGALQMAAASGISFLAASGDNGSADCSSSQNARPQAKLAVNYPASSPWATGVGGTNLDLGPDNTIRGQDVWNDGDEIPGQVDAAGGGLSDVFRRPGYQTGTVAAARRAVPDVALLADIAPGYTIYCTAQDCQNPTGPWQTVGGTSAATPLLAGGLALIDQDLRESRLQDLGLVNPLLYRIGRDPARAPQVFDDVTLGSNDVGPYDHPAGQPDGAPLGCCSAVGGYDEASGWGGVNLGALERVARATQPRIVNISLSLPARQAPVRRHRIRARITCSGACLAGALARVRIGRGTRFTAYSSLYRLGRAGGRTIAIGFSRGQLVKLRAGLRHHVRITASVLAAIVDAGGNIERRSAARTLRIRR